ncbi:MAG: hypothetical protein KF891_19455 [Rhizobacter sp.]|nr:hypothetical protein [Rhizobacter sp.]
MSRDAKPTKAATKASTQAAKPRAAALGWLDRLKRFSFLRRKPTAPPPVLKDSVRPAPAGRRVSSSKPADANGARMLAALKQVLDRHAASRTVLVHLGGVEQALQQHGLDGLQEVPAEVLRRALMQLETLVSDWSEGHLAALRAQLKAALAKPGRASAHARRSGAATGRSADFAESRVQVDEASVSTFMEARARWEQSLTGGR